MLYCDTFVLISWFTANSFYVTGLCKCHVLPNIQDDFRVSERDIIQFVNFAFSVFRRSLCEETSHTLPKHLSPSIAMLSRKDGRGEKRKFHHKLVSTWNEGKHANAGRSEKEQKQQRSVKNTRDVGRPGNRARSEQEPHGHLGTASI